MNKKTAIILIFLKNKIIEITKYVGRLLAMTLAIGVFVGIVIGISFGIGFITNLIYPPIVDHCVKEDINFIPKMIVSGFVEMMCIILIILIVVIIKSGCILFVKWIKDNWKQAIKEYEKKEVK